MRDTRITFLFIAIACLMLTLISTVMLRMTGIVDLKSQSEYWDQPNVIWYLLLHFGMIMSMFILSAVRGSTKFWYGTVAFASGFTLMFNVMGYNIPHLISTGLIFVLASISIIAYEPLYKFVYTIVCSVLAIIFLLSFLQIIPLSVYAIESIVEWIFAIIFIRRIVQIINQRVKWMINQT